MGIGVRGSAAEATTALSARRLRGGALMANGDNSIKGTEPLLVGSSGLLKERVQEKRRRDREVSAALSAAITDYGFNEIGPSSGDVLFKSTGWNIAEKPTIVMCQARQSDNLDHGWPDQFA